MAKTKQPAKAHKEPKAPKASTPKAPRRPSAARVIAENAEMRHALIAYADASDAVTKAAAGGEDSAAESQACTEAGNQCIELGRKLRDGG